VSKELLTEAQRSEHEMWSEALNNLIYGSMLQDPLGTANLVFALLEQAKDVVESDQSLSHYVFAKEFKNYNNLETFIAARELSLIFAKIAQRISKRKSRSRAWVEPPPYELQP
jgi:hypothetical protein